MKFNTRRFNAHLTNMGQKVLWRRSFGCACVNPVSGAPDPKHALCAGKGRIWEDPIETVTGIARQETVAEWAQSGLWESGDMVLSIPEASPLWDAGMYDRIVMLNSNDVFSQPLQRGAPTERLLFKPHAITRVFWLHPTTRLIVEGGIPVIGEDGVPVWSSGAPPAGTTYSMTGTKYSEYFLYDKFPSNRNEHSGMRLPKRVIARKWDLFGR